MKSTFLVIAACAITALAGPVQKRALTTTTTTETVLTTVTVDDLVASTSIPAAAIPAASSTGKSNANAFRGGRGRKSSSSSRATQAPASTQAAAQTTTQQQQQQQQQQPTTTATSTSVASNPSPSTSSSSSAAAAATSTTSSSSGTPLVEGALSDVGVSQHNVHRGNHSVSDLTWNSEIAGYASTTAATCKFAHDTATGGGGYGQNIAMWATSGDISSTSTSKFLAQSITEMWYNGEINLFPADQYGVASPDMSNFEAWGHYSQVVWAGTQSVGCAVQLCKAGTMVANMDAYFSVCNYYPAGNMGGAYGTNVKKPLGQATYSV